MALHYSFSHRLCFLTVISLITLRSSRSCVDGTSSLTLLSDATRFPEPCVPRLSTLSSSPSTSVDPDPSSNHSSSPSSFILSFQWPFTTCALNPPPPTLICQAPPASFTVEAFRSSFDNMESFPTCCGTPFLVAPIVDLAPALRRFWPDLSPSSNDWGLWRFQWLRFGSCCGLTQRTYFRRVLQLARQYDFVRTLKVAGIDVSGSKEHSLSHVQQAIDDAVGGFHVQLRCVRHHSSHSALLHKLQVCLSPSHFAVVDCQFDQFDSFPGTATSLEIPCNISTTVLIPFRSLDFNHPGDGNVDNNHNVTSPRMHNYGPLPLAHAALFVFACLVTLCSLAFCVFYQCRFAVQHSRHLRSSRSYYHPIQSPTERGATT